MSNAIRRAAIVTGAAGGIGSAITARLEKDGVDVLAVDLDPAETGRGPAPAGVPFAADLSTREGNENAVRAALEQFGRLDIIVANAGFQHVAPIAELSRGSLGRADRADADQPVPAGEVRLVLAARGPRRRPVPGDRVRARPGRVPVQGRLRRGQARRPGPGEDAGAGGRRAWHLRLRHLPVVRANTTGREPNRRAGRGAQHVGGAGAPRRDPGGPARQTSHRTRGGGRGGKPSCSAHTADRSPAFRSRWIRAGPPDEGAELSARHRRLEKRHSAATRQRFAQRPTTGPAPSRGAPRRST